MSWSSPTFDWKGWKIRDLYQESRSPDLQNEGLSLIGATKETRDLNQASRSPDLQKWTSVTDWSDQGNQRLNSESPLSRPPTFEGGMPIHRSRLRKESATFRCLSTLIIDLCLIRDLNVSSPNKTKPFFNRSVLRPCLCGTVACDEPTVHPLLDS